MKNFYDIIGVEKSADFATIKKAYLNKIKEYHPDVYEGDKFFAEQKTAELTEAFNTLKNEETRKVYDEKLNFEIQNSSVIPTNDNLKQTENAKDENLLKEVGNKFKNFFAGLKDDLKTFFENNKKRRKQIKDFKQSNKDKKFDANKTKQTRQTDSNLDNQTKEVEVENLENEDIILTKEEILDIKKRRIIICILFAVLILLFVLIRVLD